jgi:hypothetical protein
MAFRRQSGRGPPAASASSSFSAAASGDTDLPGRIGDCGNNDLSGTTSAASTAAASPTWRAGLTRVNCRCRASGRNGSKADVSAGLNERPLTAITETAVNGWDGRKADVTMGVTEGLSPSASDIELPTLPQTTR